jgi:hypothetical protein
MLRSRFCTKTLLAGPNYRIRHESLLARGLDNGILALSRLHRTQYPFDNPQGRLAAKETHHLCLLFVLKLLVQLAQARRPLMSHGAERQCTTGPAGSHSTGAHGQLAWAGQGRVVEVEVHANTGAASIGGWTVRHAGAVADGPERTLTGFVS